MNFIKHEKGAKLRANIKEELEGKKGSKHFFRVLEFFSKISNIKKYLMKTYIFVKRKYLWMKS